MTFQRYIDRERGDVSARNFMLTMAKDLGDVSLSTLYNCYRGSTIDSYSKAKKISEACGGSVRIKDLCEA